MSVGTLMAIKFVAGLVIIVGLADGFGLEGLPRTAFLILAGCPLGWWVWRSREG